MQSPFSNLQLIYTLFYFIFFLIYSRNLPVIYVYIHIYILYQHFIYAPYTVLKPCQKNLLISRVLSLFLIYATYTQPSEPHYKNQKISTLHFQIYSLFIRFYFIHFLLRNLPVIYVYIHIYILYQYFIYAPYAALRPRQMNLLIIRVSSSF